MILDTPETNEKDMAEFFCDNITRGEYHNIHFSFDGVTETLRVILKGDATEVLSLVNAYEAKYRGSV